MKYTRNFHIIFAFWYFSVLQTFAQHDALVFDRFTRSLHDIPTTTQGTSLCGAWATACPAQAHRERIFIYENAFTLNALFVRGVYSKEETIDEANFKKLICLKPFSMSVLFSKSNFSFEFGYEVYFPIADASLFQESPRENFILPKSVFQYMSNILKLPKFLYKEAKRSILGEKKHFWYNGNHEMGFTWVRLFDVKFDFKRKTPKRITYEIRNNNKWPLSPDCKMYNLAKEAYSDDVDFDYLYSMQNQRQVFHNIKLPDDLNDASYELKYVAKWLLIPVDQFHFDEWKLFNCSNMTTVPVWISTAGEVMEKLEKFLYALFRVIGPGLQIISGVSGKLRMPKIDSKIWKPSTKDIYLNPAKKIIPVPAILYKVVKYKPSNCPPKNNCWYSATIVVHNGPFFDLNDEICNEDMISEWGWSFPRNPKYDIYRSEYIYVCQSTPKVLKRLMGASWREEPTQMLDLNLRKFPSYTKAQLEQSFAETNAEIEPRTESIWMKVQLKYQEFLPLQIKPRRAYFTPMEEGDEKEDGENSQSGDDTQFAPVSGAIESPSSNRIVERPHQGDADGWTAGDEITHDHKDDDNDQKEIKAEGKNPKNIYDDETQEPSGSSRKNAPDVAFHAQSESHSSSAGADDFEERRHNTSPVSESETVPPKKTSKTRRFTQSLKNMLPEKWIRGRSKLKTPMPSPGREE